ncbi:hypothetical protein BPMI_04392c [Candidatus Burkholderia pumila]|uniref:YecA family protein n=1 Tax=Candidatus Burkholderia pumila TaxID=1090375 RepID=A0ABR5HJZ9_9BURK|nr:hypothetical protein BPMI_04392c [Candidatus Burkholderia pumila]
MNDFQLDGSLSENELDRLNAFFESRDQGVANVEMLDGFFAALICGPEIVPISETLPMVWGLNFEFKTEDQETDTNLVMRHLSSVAMVLMRTLHELDAYEPVLFEDEDGFVPANAWPAASWPVSKCVGTSGIC